MEIGKQVPNFFRRFAEKMRTYLFDLGRIGEITTSEIIERICLKLQLREWLAWNERRGSGLEKRNLLTFGRWLCRHDAAYQNAYSLAAEQLQVPPATQTHWFTRTHSTNVEAERKRYVNRSSGKNGIGRNLVSNVMDRIGWKLVEFSSR